MRKTPFVNKEYYHIFNRGVDKRKVFLSSDDFNRFLQSIDEFNSVVPIGGIYENAFNKKKLGHSMSKPKPKSKSKSSWDEYINGNDYSLCDKSIILDQFNNVM